ncbi:hypothetical protein [Microcystis phage Mel-JY34]
MSYEFDAQDKPNVPGWFRNWRNANNSPSGAYALAGSGGWRPHRPQELHVLPGSALDVGGLRRTAVPAGARGAVRIHASDETKLAEADAPTVERRFNVATWAPSQGTGALPLDKKLITAGVEHLARQGFNALRFHGIELWLCAGSSRDFDFPAERLDALDWLFAECKRVGLYWILNPRQPELYQGGANRFSMPAATLNYKPRIFVQEDARTHYKTGFNLLYNRINPYIGTSILRDPALLMIEWFNEISVMQITASTWPTVWTTRESARGTAAMTFNEWLADPGMAHGYANIAALNTSWGTAHANFTVIPVPGTRPTFGVTATQQGIDVFLYAYYIEQNVAQFFADFAMEIQYYGLGATQLSAPCGYNLRAVANSAADQVHNTHDYVFTSPSPAVNASLDTVTSNIPVWDAPSWAAGAGVYTQNRPNFLGEYGWPYWGEHRNQYPLMAAIASMQGAAGLSYFHQGNFTFPRYDGQQNDRIRQLFPYENHSDPVAQFGQVANFFIYALGYVTEGAVSYNIEFNDRYTGVNPRNTGRINRAPARMFSPLSFISFFSKHRIRWDSGTVDDTMASTLITRDWKAHLDELVTATAITADNLGLASVNANRGTVTAVTISGTVGTVTATATQPVLTIGSNTLVDGDWIHVTNLTGSGGTWPGTNNRATRMEIKQTGVANQVQILNGLNLTGTSGFTAGTWCESVNVVQSGNKEVYWSRRAKVGAITPTKFKYFFDAGANPAVYPFTTGLTGFSVQSCSPGAAFFVGALDDRTLATSRSMLLGLCGASRNAGQTFTSATKLTLAAVGNYPLIVSNVVAEFILDRTSWGRFALDALDMDGSILQTYDVSNTEGGLQIRLDGSTGAIFFHLRMID